MMDTYKGAKPLDPQTAPVSKEAGKIGLGLGLVRNLSPREIDLGASAYMEDIRFERSGIRKEFGDRALGTNADSRILSIIEHKYIDSNNLQHRRLLRVRREDDGRPRIEIWNGDTEVWENDCITDTQIIDDEYVRAISVLGVLLLACYGSPILKREETILYTDDWAEFPAGNSLTAIGYSALATIYPDDVVKNNEYTVNFDVDLTLNTGSNLVVTVAVYAKETGNLVASRDYSVSTPGSDSWPDETFVFQAELEDGDWVSLIITNINCQGSQTTQYSGTFSDQGASTPRYQATKTQTDEAYNDVYVYRFYLSVEPGGTVTIGYYYDSGSGWVKHSEEVFPEDFYDYVERNIVIDGMGTGTKFGLHVESDTGPGGFFSPPPPDPVKWIQSNVSYSVDVHGHNVPSDSDASHGVEFEVEDGWTVTLAPISGAPDATWIEPFADRVIALRDGGDTQLLSACSDGDVDEWTAGDSVASPLVDARSEPIDDLQCAGPLASNVLALIRSRSIMKVFETGNYDLAVGATHWIEGIGTESPHSIAIVPSGLVFLGHDYMVYFLTEGGINGIGQEIQQDLVDTLTGYLHRVDGIYDPIYQEYYLGIPENGEEYITTTFIFDLGTYFSSGGQIKRWRKRKQSIERYALVSEV